MDNSTSHRIKKREGFLGQKMVIIPQNIRRSIQKNPIINNLYLTDIGYYPNAKHHFRNRKDGADEYILIYCVEGNGWVNLHSTSFYIGPNSYFIIPVSTAHTYAADKQNPWSIYWVHFTGNSAEKLFEKYCLKESISRAGPNGFKLPFEQRRIDYFDRVISLLESGYSTEIVEYVNLNLWQLLASFIYHDFYSEVRHKNNDTDIVASAILYMQKNINHAITIDELADHLSYSNSYLYSLFKNETGYSPIHYFNHLKIQKACQYLSFTDMSVKEISYELGFNDPFYFSRLFKKLMDLSPTDYRMNL